MSEYDYVFRPANHFSEEGDEKEMVEDIMDTAEHLHELLDGEDDNVDTLGR